MTINNSILFKHLFILSLALILDQLIGEFPEKIHPTVLAGKTANFLKTKLKTGRKNLDKIGGTALVLILLGIFVTPVCIITHFHDKIHWLIYITIMTPILKSTFSVKSMEEHSNQVLDRIEEGNIDEARKETGKIVSRNTDNMDIKYLSSSTIESVSESITDGITSPLFFFAILGVPGAIGFRVINTLDSMFGYKDSENENFGLAPAKTDTILNFIPARITLPIIAVSAGLLGKNWKDSFLCAIKEGNKTSSLNSGLPMAAAAGALNIRLEKKNHYILGIKKSEPSKKHILEALELMKVTTIIFTGLIVTFFGILMMVV